MRLLACPFAMHPHSSSSAITGFDAIRTLVFADRCAQAAAGLSSIWPEAGNDRALPGLVDELLVRAVRCGEADAVAASLAHLAPVAPPLLAHWAHRLLHEQAVDPACRLIDRVIDVAPGFAAPGGALAAMLRQLDDADLACALLRRLHQRRPDDADLLRLHGESLVAAEFRDEAAHALHRLASLCPSDPYPIIELGRLALAGDDRAQARSRLQSALTLDPDNVAALWELAQLDDWDLTPAQIDHVHALCRSVRDPKALAGLHAIAGRLADREGNAGEAARHAGIANTLLTSCNPASGRYDPRQHRAWVETLVRECTPQWLQRLHNGGADDPRPIFIVGLPRSGTTLLERMLAAHPAIVGVGEQAFAIGALRRALRASGGGLATLTPAAVASAAQWHRHRLDDRLQRLALDPTAARIVDKMPDNYLLAGWIRAMFPRATIIHCLRDPRDVALSCWLTHFVGVPWSCNLQHIVARIECHRHVLRHWRTLPGMNLHELRYESLIGDPRRTLGALLEAMNLPWHGDLLDVSARAGYVASASHRQVRHALHARSIARWRAHESTLQPIRARLEAIVKEDEAIAIPASTARIVREEIDDAG